MVRKNQDGGFAGGSDGTDLKRTTRGENLVSLENEGEEGQKQRPGVREGLQIREGESFGRGEILAFG